MKSLKLIFFVLSATTAMTTAAVPLIDGDDKQSQFTLSENDHQGTVSLRGVSRLLLAQQQKLVAANNLTCNKFPRVCRLKSNQGRPDCCKKKCVNVKTDGLNCGMCGHKCKYPEICCKGRCVNASFDKRNCGGCNKKCKKGHMCENGMCNYA